MAESGGATFVAAYLLLKESGTVYRGESPSAEGHHVHPGEIMVLKFDWGLEKQKSDDAGGGGNSQTSTGQFDDITITKYVDSTSPLLAQAVATAEGKASFERATLSMCRSTGLDLPVDFLVIDMFEVTLHDWHITADGADDSLPTEVLKLGFRSVQFTYTPIKAWGEGGATGHSAAAITIGWDQGSHSEKSASAKS